MGCGFLNAGGQRENAVVHGSVLKTAWPLSCASGLLKHDSQFAAGGQFHAFAQAAGAAKAVEHARDGAGVLAKFGGFALETVDFLDDFDGKEDVVLLEIEQGVGVVEEDIGIEISSFSRRKRFESGYGTSGECHRLRRLWAAGNR